MILNIVYCYNIFTIYSINNNKDDTFVSDEIIKKKVNSNDSERDKLKIINYLKSEMIKLNSIIKSLKDENKKLKKLINNTNLEKEDLEKNYIESNQKNQKNSKNLEKYKQLLQSSQQEINKLKQQMMILYQKNKELDIKYNMQNLKLSQNIKTLTNQLNDSLLDIKQLQINYNKLLEYIKILKEINNIYKQIYIDLIS